MSHQALPKCQRLWTAEEDRWLRANYHDYTYLECAARLRRSLSSIRYRAERLGLRKAPSPWSEEEKRRLRTLYNVIGPAATARELGRSSSSCWDMAFRLDLTGKQRRRWTTSEVDLVRRVVLALAERLGRTPDAIAVRCRLVVDQMKAGKRKPRRKRHPAGKADRIPGLAEVLAEVARGG